MSRNIFSDKNEQRVARKHVRQTSFGKIIGHEQTFAIMQMSIHNRKKVYSRHETIIHLIQMVVHDNFTSAFTNHQKRKEKTLEIIHYIYTI